MQECGSSLYSASDFWGEGTVSRSTDVSIIPCWAEEFAYYQGLPCPAVLIKSAHWWPKDQSRVLGLLSSRSSTCTSLRKRKTHQACCSAWISAGKGCSKAGLTLEMRRSSGDTAYSSHSPPSNPQAEATALLPTPKKCRFWTSTSENT